jgi:predicted phosphoribosyltransferase
LQSIRPRGPHELIVAVPVAPPERLAEISQWCDEIICLRAPRRFWAIGQFYENFEQVEDEQMLDLLRPSAPAARRKTAIGAAGR